MLVECTQPIKRLSRDMLAACERLPGFEWRAYGVCGLVGTCYVKICEYDICYGCKAEDKMSTFLQIFGFLRENGVIVNLDGPERFMFSLVLKVELDMHDFARRHGLPFNDRIHVRILNASVFFRSSGCVIKSTNELDVEEAEIKALEMMA